MKMTNIHGKATLVSAGAKIPIVPIEFSTPLDVVNRDALQMEEVPKLVKGERRARTQRTATARNEHPGDQRVDRLAGGAVIEAVLTFRVSDPSWVPRVGVWFFFPFADGQVFGIRGFHSLSRRAGFSHKICWHSFS